LHAHGSLAAGIPAPLQVQFNLPFVFRRPAVADRDILFGQRSPAKYLVQPAKRLFILGDKDRARGIAVEPVNKGKIINVFDFSAGEQISGSQVDKRIVVKMSAARMHNKSDRLVADEKIIVFVQDGKIAFEKLGFDEPAVCARLPRGRKGQFRRICINVDYVAQNEAIVLADPAMPVNTDSAPANHRIYV
jgi:hypothetical protein